MGEKVQGNLVIVGGAEDKEKECIILKKVIELAGGNGSDRFKFYYHLGRDKGRLLQCI